MDIDPNDALNILIHQRNEALDKLVHAQATVIKLQKELKELKGEDGEKEFVSETEIEPVEKT